MLSLESSTRVETADEIFMTALVVDRRRASPQKSKSILRGEPASKGTPPNLKMKKGYVVSKAWGPKGGSNLPAATPVGHFAGHGRRIHHPGTTRVSFCGQWTSLRVSRAPRGPTRRPSLYHS